MIESLRIELFLVSLASIFAYSALIYNIIKQGQDSISLKIIGQIMVLGILEQSCLLFYNFFTPSDENFVVGVFIILLHTWLIYMSMGWSLGLSYHSCQVIISKKQFNQPKFYRRLKRIILAIPILTIVTIIPLIKIFEFSEYLNPVMQAYCILPVLILLIMSIYYYNKQALFIDSNYERTTLNSLNVNIRKLTLYPWIEVLINGPSLIFIYELSTAQNLNLPYRLDKQLMAFKGIFQLIVYSLIRSLAISDLEYRSKDLETEEEYRASIVEVEQDLDTDQMLKQALMAG